MNPKFSVFLVAVAVLAAPARAQEPPFPLAGIVAQARRAANSVSRPTTGLGREDYLMTSAGIVNFFQHFQTPAGRIIDPYLGREVQYSTPCYAWAAAALVESGRQTNLLESAARALDAALDELSRGQAADNHGDFFTFPSLLAYEALRQRVAPGRRKQWEDQLRSISPELVYQDVPSRREPHNWNIVALAGEFLRQQDGFCDLAFVENSLGAQMKNFSANGQYIDPGAPMAYDHFPRSFLAAMIARGYHGAHYDALTNLLERAAWTSLLIQSPRGEWPTGGRSAQHQWNEAMQCVTYEIWAARTESEGDDDGARLFKRGAHLALQSVRRWVRPSGELWIVKNYFDPSVRHGFQDYSAHSQYNLLAASMMSVAWLFADDRISESPCPAETGGFAFALPEFHKVFANAGGLYLEIDTAAAPAYNSTGLVRVQKTGVDSLLGPSDTSPIDEQPAAVGVSWRQNGHWQSLAGLAEQQFKAADFSLQPADFGHVGFRVRYLPRQAALPIVTETYDVTPQRVQVTAEVEGVSEIKVGFPALAFDGAHATRIAVDGPNAKVNLGDSRETFAVSFPSNITLTRSGTWVSFRNGFLEMIEGAVAGNRVVYSLAPETAKGGAE